MPNHFTKNFTELAGSTKYHLSESPEDPFIVDDQFNWVRDVFEPLLVKDNADRNLLELVTDDSSEPVRMTYQQAVETCNQLVNFLRRQGVQRGDRVFILCGLQQGLWVSYLAAIKAGFILIPAPSILSADDVVYRLQKAAPKVIVSDLENVAKLEQALGQYSTPVLVKLLLDGEQNGWFSPDITAGEEREAIAEDTRKDEDLFWFFTSGTTGMPKVVVHTHASYPLGHLTTAAWIGLKPGDRHYNIAQPGWAKFAWSSFFAPLNRGATVFVYKPKGRFVASDQLRILQDHQITTFCAPPTALRLLIQEPLSNYRFCLRECVSAGEPLNAEVIKIWQEGTGIELRDGYGQTESTCMICNLPGSTVKFGSMGKPTFLYDIVIADADGKELPLHETGQVAVRMHPGHFSGIFKSYAGDPERERDVFKHGLYYTGDKAYKDQDGYYWFVGRDDDVIKTSGYRVGPFEIESVLLELDEIQESAVVGSPHPLKGQDVKAFVVLTADIAGTQALADKIFAHCKSHLAPYKVPRLVEFVTELPKTISGKIRRVELRALQEQRKVESEPIEQEFCLP